MLKIELICPFCQSWVRQGLYGFINCNSCGASFIIEGDRITCSQKGLVSW